MALRYNFLYREIIINEIHIDIKQLIDYFAKYPDYFIFDLQKLYDVEDSPIQLDYLCVFCFFDIKKSFKLYQKYHMHYYIYHVIRMLSYYKKIMTEIEHQDFIELFRYFTKHTNLYNIPNNFNGFYFSNPDEFYDLDTDIEYKNIHKELIDTLNNITKTEIIYKSRTPFLNFVWRLPKSPIRAFENHDIVRQIAGFI